MKNKVKGVLFDFNGTMIFDSAIHRAVWRDFMPKLTGKAVADEEIDKKMLGRDNASIFRSYLGDDIDPSRIERLTYEKELAYREKCLVDPVHFRFVDGLEELLNYLKGIGMPMTIATGSEVMNITFFFEQFHLDRWFDFSKVVYDDGTFPGKPAPDIYLMAARKLEADPADCLVFEDSHSGVAAAHAAGIGYVLAVNETEKAPAYDSVGGVLAAENNFRSYIEYFK